MDEGIAAAGFRLGGLHRDGRRALMSRPLATRQTAVGGATARGVATGAGWRDSGGGHVVVRAKHAAVALGFSSIHPSRLDTVGRGAVTAFFF
jgi:hypothetical protein